MRARRIYVCAILSSYPDSCAKLDNLHQILNRYDLPLGQPYDIHIALCILPRIQNVPLVQ